jgi:Ca2+-binding RTX toxin-like protein
VAAAALTAATLVPNAGAHAEVHGPECFGVYSNIWGTPGGDTIWGTPGRDVIHAGPGADTVYALGGNDLVCGGYGADTIRFGAGVDTGFGEEGHDVCWVSHRERVHHRVFCNVLRGGHR